MKLQITVYGTLIVLAMALVGYVLYVINSYSSPIHGFSTPAQTETVAVATPTPTPKHVRTHLELVNFVQSLLVVNITNRRLEREYLYVYGTLTNNTNAALRWVGVPVTAYNDQKQVVNDSSLFPAGSGYLQSGQTLKFSTMFHDKGGEIVYTDAVVDPVSNMVLDSGLFQ